MRHQPGRQSPETEGKPLSVSQFPRGLAGRHRLVSCGSRAGPRSAHRMVPFLRSWPWECSRAYSGSGEVIADCSSLLSARKALAQLGTRTVLRKRTSVPVAVCEQWVRVSGGSWPLSGSPQVSDHPSSDKGSRGGALRHQGIIATSSRRGGVVRFYWE